MMSAILYLVLTCGSLLASSNSASRENKVSNLQVGGDTEQSTGTCQFADGLISCNKTSETCNCGDSGMHCKVPTASNKTVLVSSCVTFDNDTGMVDVGECLYIGSKEIEYSRLLTNASCDTSFNRAGMLCGRCEEGYYMPSYSFDMTCIRCPNGKSDWWKFILAAFLPLTVFCFIVLLLRVNLTSSYLHGYVFYAQMISSPTVVRVAIIVTKREYPNLMLRIIASLYSIWNLDFFRFLNTGICVGTDTLQTVALNYIIAIYPLALLVQAYILIYLYDYNFKLVVTLWKPFRTIFSFFHSHWEVKTSLIDAFASFLLLAICKVLSVSFDLLIPVKVYHLDSRGHLICDYRLFLDATIPYFGKQHLPYAILAIVMLVLIVLLPLVVLSLYPFQWFHKVLNLIPTRWYILHTFVDSFQGCYKDGTEPGTRDCRWFASLFLFVRLLFFIIGAVTLGVMFYAYSTIVLLLVVILLVIFQPFKQHLHHYTFSNVSFLMALATWSALIVDKEYAKVVEMNLSRVHAVRVYIVLLGFVGVLPLVYITVIILWWMYRKRRFGLELMKKMRAWRHGYVNIQGETVVQSSQF